MTQYETRFSVLLKSLSLKNPKAQMYQNEERISFKTLTKQRWKENREERNCERRAVKSFGKREFAFGMKFAYHNFRLACGFPKWLHNSKCCKVNFTVIIDNTKNN